MRSPFVLQCPLVVEVVTKAAKWRPLFCCLNLNALVMQNTRMTAGETAKTKKGWGIVAVIGVVVALTMGDSLIMAAIGTAMLAAGAYFGGYMNETSQKLRKTSANTVNAVERRAA